ncbi:GNAT family N-acetyltransferase [Novosphingobium album (ex Hu et al. 2023)]|uniref:GNAT family N-acetyltransferase n=1 Tax=Novosphingobium album (ex Hu et al. 2023) TaxID=2930093 RepID=A0ABT0B1G6_9SPHN|nr:GNAT family N-acetyltransferase [Novosphingobium album (ex Hu et al. 2023)]MCJ2178913.1 GNAT family N-acetyltransferase [Novosphingobium album (ex Hu et al. 2023)]
MTKTSQLTTRTGISLSVRPASEGDETILGAFFDAVSDDDRRFRFLAASEHVSQEQLAPLLKVDHFQSESFLAFDVDSGELVASALLACDAGLDTGEIAVSIRSDYKGKGVGWALLDFLAGEARERGVRRVISIESRDNHAAIELEREKGFTPEPFDDDQTLVVLSKNLR